ncbi:putative alcohol dehydrogenase [Bombardia bombarda]|uniref:Alcohol dehydrogenase n=1 Tax=Bombardia bombarda TaxID=252184 RepID=A0AA39XBX1_9PEZI|nr:putative alcohol dehydrogenase [Bombardia bombarda]
MVSPHPSRKVVRQYLATKKGGPFQVATASFPTPGPNEVCIRNRAVGLNAIDWKNLSHGQLVKTWPEVFGVDAAGIVEDVGSNVEDFKPGDAVMTFAGHGGPAGAFQEVTMVPSHYVSKKPSCWTFVEASSVPIIYLTAAAAISKGLNIPLPYLLEEAKMPAVASIVVLGGSSGVGASAIQLLRIALPTATILSTNSPRNNAAVAKHGATACFDRNDPKLVAALRAASPGGNGVDAILDAVAGASERTKLFDVLRADGPRLYSQVMTGAQVNVPENVRSVAVYARMVFDVPGGMRAMGKLGELGEAGKFKLPLSVEVVGKGLEAIGPGLDKLKEGVSGTKLVVGL